MQVNLPADWAAIVKDYPCDGSPRFLAEQLYALHCKPRKGLTDKEIYEAYWGAGCSGPVVYLCGLRAVIAAHERKQHEPEAVTFRAARNTVNGSIDVFPLKPNGDVDNEYFHSARWEWLEPPQTFEVNLS